MSILVWGNCMTCKSRFITWNMKEDPSYVTPIMCGDCKSNEKALGKDGEDIEHDRGVVCPSCGHFHSDTWEHEGIYEEGSEKEFSCESCDLDFHVETSVRYTFKSTMVN